MVDNVFCTVSLPEQANEAVTRMERLGFRPDEVIVATEVSEVEKLMHTEAEFARSTIIGVIIGAAAGFLLAVAVLAYMGPELLFMPGAIMMPIFNAGCWALIGSIVGCGGIFASRRLSAEVEHRFEKEVAQSKFLVAVPMKKTVDLREIRATLSEVGATNIHYSGEVA